MKDNQEEDISWLFLWGATILYIAVLCMCFAGLAVTRPTVGTAFLDFTKDYGSLLAGIPVLIAVLVAKQQLDANRRQHVAQIKRSLKNELDAFEEMEAHFSVLADLTKKDALTLGVNHIRRGFDPMLENDEMFKKWSMYASSSLMELMKTTNKTFLDAECDFRKSGPSSTNDAMFNYAGLGAGMVLNFVHERQKQLSQYWS